MSKWTRVRSNFDRAHSDLFGSQSRYNADFYNYSTGSYDPDEGEMTSQNRSSFATNITVEIVPPGQDSTVETSGTDFSWTTSIRFPDQSFVSNIVPLGQDAEKPTEVEITDLKTDSMETFELHSYTTEVGSDMILCRLVEQ